MPYMEFNAKEWDNDEIINADHAYKLPKPDKTVLYINYHQTGVSGDTTWGTLAHQQFTLYSNTDYTFKFSIQGIYPTSAR